MEMDNLAIIPPQPRIRLNVNNKTVKLILETQIIDVIKSDYSEHLLYVFTSVKR